MLVETKPRLTKETAFVLGMFLFDFCLFVCLPSSSLHEGAGRKSSLSRTLDVYDLQELSDEPDPHATLPFISHHTLNLSRDLVDNDNEPNNCTNNCEFYFLTYCSDY